MSTTVEAASLEVAGISDDPGGTASVGSESRLYRWMPRIVVALCMFLASFAGLGQQMVIVTVFSNILSGNIRQMAFTMTVMMLMMGAGGLAQLVIRGNWMVPTFIVAELLLTLGGFGPAGVQWLYVELPESSFHNAQLIATAAPGFLIGLEIPLMIRIINRWTKDVRTNIAEVLPWDYAGAGLGGIAFMVMLMRYTPLTEMSYWFALCNLVVAVICLAFFWKRGLLAGRPMRAGLTLATIAMTLLLFYGATNAQAWSRQSIQQMYDDPVVADFTTPYQNIVLTKGNHPTDPFGHSYAMYLNGNKQFDSGDELIYHENLVHPAMNLAARRDHVLVLGGGDGMALREILKYDDVQDVTLVDLDPDMIKFSSTNPIMRELNNHSFQDARVTSSLNNAELRSNPGVTDTGEQRVVMGETDEVQRVECDAEDQSTCDEVPVTKPLATVNVYTVDASRFVSAVDGRLWDVVIVDLPDPNSVDLAKLYSLEFYQRVKHAVAPDGMVVVQSASPYFAQESFLCILRTMTAAGLNVVPYHRDVHSFGDWGWLLGAPRLSSEQIRERIARMESFDVETSSSRAEVLRASLVFDGGVLASNRETISTLMEPVIYQYYVDEGWRVD